MADNVWTTLLHRLRRDIDEEDFRRWFGATALASDAGDQITIWVPTESIRRHINAHYEDALRRVLSKMGRPAADLRFVVAGYADDEDDDEDDVE